MFLKFSNFLLAGLFLCGGNALNADVAPQPQQTLTLPQNPVTPEDGLKRLIEGNKRFSQDKLTSPGRDQERRLALVSTQAPFAVIVGCSDSRVSPEILFDQGVGDLFIVRNAGNVVNDVGTDSIEYSVNHLKSSVIVVLGHQNCGAVAAVVGGQDADIESVAKLIAPAVKKVRGESGNILENAIKMNVKLTVEQLKNSSEFSKLIQDKKLIVVGGYYNLETGLVEIL